VSFGDTFLYPPPEIAPYLCVCVLKELNLLMATKISTAIILTLKQALTT
jgi:hypothetical protein